MKKKSRMNPIFSLWNRQLKLDRLSQGFSLSGFSIAAFRTNFYIPELDIMFDAGIPANVCPKDIFISHGHADHIANLPLHLFTAKENGQTVNIYCPASIARNLEQYIKSLSYCAGAKPCGYRLVPLDESINHFKIIRGIRQEYIVDTFKCHHTVPCLGYGISEVRKRLKEEYKGKAGSELALAKKQGIQIEEYYQTPLIVFLGDTTPRVFLENPDIFRYPYIITECTFLDDKDEADKKKHTCWIDLEPIIRSNPETIFILTHFSQTYTEREITEYFQKNTDLPNIYLWISQN